MRYYEQHRMEWIGETMHIFGFINREHIETKFGLSTPQASADLRRYQQLHPDQIYYDKSMKCYRVKYQAPKAVRA